MEKVVGQLKSNNYERSVGLIQRYLICGYFLLAFFEPYLNGTLGSLAKYYIILLMVASGFCCKKFVIRSFHWFFLCWLTFKMFSMVWSPNSYIPNLHLFSQIGMVALLVILTAIPIDNKTIRTIIFTMWFGSVVIGVLSLFFSHPYHGEVSTRQVLYLFGQEADPNNQAAFLLVGLTIALYCLVIARKYRLLSIATIAVNSLTLFMTGSRGGLVTLVCVGIVLLFASLRGKTIDSKIRIVLIAVFVCGMIYLIVSKFLPQDIIERLFNFSSYEGGSDRDIIWENGWELFTSGYNFLFGAGWGAYYGYNGIYKAMHNTFLSMLCDVGIVGFLLFFIPILRASFSILKKGKILPVLLILSGFVPSFFVEAINKRFFWNVIFLLLIVYVNCEDMISKERNEIC